MVACVVMYGLRDYLYPKINLFVLPGGTAPVRMTEEAVGYDTYLRAIVDPVLMEDGSGLLRKALFDFRGRTDPKVEKYSCIRTPKPGDPAMLAYRLDPGQKALCGVGFVIGMPFPLAALVLCRSGMATRHEIVVSNGPGTIDPDYRGEAGVHLWNTGNEPFYLFHGMRISQFLFVRPVIPRFGKVLSHADIKASKRDVGGFGHTGLFGSVCKG